MTDVRLSQRVYCAFGFHKWAYRQHDWASDGTGREGLTLREGHCPTCKCSWLREGVARYCRRGCGMSDVYEGSSWKAQGRQAGIIEGMALLLKAAAILVALFLGTMLLHWWLGIG